MYTIQNFTITTLLLWYNNSSLGLLTLSGEIKAVVSFHFLDDA